MLTGRAQPPKGRSSQKGTRVPLRISLTISGAVALGAYEGGALAALLYAVRPLMGEETAPVRVDVISGASAGSITALLAARALQQGHDPEKVMAGAWVVGDSFGALLAHGTDAPLSIEKLRDLGSGLLDPDGQRATSRQSTPIRLSYTLACLRGLEYRLARLGREPVASVTYVDYFDHELQPQTALEEITGPPGSDRPRGFALDAALASAANAMGFPPYLLDRSRQWPDYKNNGVDNLPPGEQLWFTDGGTLDNEPLGRTLDLTNDADSQDAAEGMHRLHLLIHPHPTAATSGAHWADPTVQPSFVQTAIRAFGLQRAQSLYGDLKQAEKTNSRISWLHVLSDHLGPELDRLPDEMRTGVAAALSAAINQMQRDRAQLRADRAGTGVTAAEQRAEPASPSRLLEQALSTASGTGGKRPARIDVISPLLLPQIRDGSHTVEQMLSGELLFHFGGFLDEKMRRNDFDLGYRSTLSWLDAGGLSNTGLGDDAIRTARAAAVSGYVPGDGWKETGNKTVGSLLAMHPWQAARLTGKLAQVLAHDVFHHPTP